MGLLLGAASNVAFSQGLREVDGMRFCSNGFPLRFLDFLDFSLFAFVRGCFGIEHNNLNMTALVPSSGSSFNIHFSACISRG